MAFIGGQDFVLDRAMITTYSPGPTRAFSDLTNTLHIKALRAELRKHLAIFASRSLSAEMLGTSWAVLSSNTDPAKRGQGILLVEVGTSGMSKASPATRRTSTGQQGAPSPPTGAQPTTKPAKLHQAQSHIRRAFHAAKGMKLLSKLPGRHH